MTNLEAIEELKYDCNELGKAIPCDTGWGVAIDSAYDMAVKALEKQIPKKIVHKPEAGREADWTCPACKWTCSPYARHCQNCGQALYNEEYGKD